MEVEVIVLLRQVVTIAAVRNHVHQAVALHHLHHPEAAAEAVPR